VLRIDRLSNSPIFEQVIDQFENLIARGGIMAGEQLPSVRTLSQELSINPNTIQKAYTEMERRGLCKTAQGSGRFVAPEAKALIIEAKRNELDNLGQAIAAFINVGISKAEILKSIEQACSVIEIDQKGGGST